MTSSLPSPPPRPTVQKTRCIPRSVTGLVPTSFKRAMEDAASPDKWTKLPPRPPPEIYPYRGDRVAAARDARKPKMQKPTKVKLGTDNKKTTKMEDAVRSKKNTETGAKTKTPKYKNQWDAHLQGDECMYRLSNQENVARAEIRAQYKEYLQQLAKERKEREDHKVQTDVSRTTAKKHEHVMCARNKAFSMNRKGSSASRIKPVKRNERVGEGSRAVPDAVEAHCIISCPDDDQTIRSSVTTAINDNESVIAARAALEEARRRLKLGEMGNFGTNVKTQPARDKSICADDESILSAVTMAIRDDASVRAARAALDEARSRLEHLGFLSNKEETLSLYRARGVELLGGDSTPADSEIGTTAGILNDTEFPLGYSSKDVEDQSLPSVITVDKFPSVGIASQCDEVKQISSVGCPLEQHQTEVKHSVQRKHRCLSISVRAPESNRIPPPRGPSYLDWISCPINTNTQERCEPITTTTTSVFETADEVSHVLELRSVDSESTTSDGGLGWPSEPNQAAVVKRQNRRSSISEAGASESNQVPSPKGLSYLDWISRPIHTNTQERYERLTTTAPLEIADEVSHVLEFRSVECESATLDGSYYNRDGGERHEVGVILYPEAMQSYVDDVESQKGSQPISSFTDHEHYVSSQKVAFSMETDRAISMPDRKKSEYHFSTPHYEAAVPVISVNTGSHEDWSVPA